MGISTLLVGRLSAGVSLRLSSRRVPEDGQCLQHHRGAVGHSQSREPEPEITTVQRALTEGSTWNKKIHLIF